MSVRFALLGLLSQRSRHGYDLHAAFEALMGGEQNWDVKPAQVYSTLGRLEEAGLVAEVEQPAGGESQDKRVYVITVAGRAALSAWLASGVEREHHHDESFLKLMLALLTGDPPARRVLQAQRAALYRELHAVTAQRNQADPQRELAKILLLDKAGMHLEADLRWLDMVEARLDEVQRQPPPEPETRPRGRPRKTKAAAGA